MRRLFYSVAAIFALTVLAPDAGAQQPQGGRITLDSLDRLAPLAAKAQRRTDKTPDGKGMVYVREFEFREAGAFQEADLAALRAQVSGPGWSQMMKVEDKDDPDGPETVEIYVYTRKVGSRIQGGMLIITTEPKELTVVNVAGEGDAKQMLEQLRREEVKQK
jgi:hypothetical protein